uniref:Pentapeptide repeat-containing protein n=1 Tax=Arundo donax TaxID=35708 RepID=A0A0A9CQX9_ARUDO
MIWFWLCVTYPICLLMNSGADLSDADLRGADFSLANLSKVHCSTSLLVQNNRLVRMIELC